MPSAPPSVSPMIGAQIPTTTEIRAPWITRDSSSRPRPSVPSQWSNENGARFSSMSMSVGLGSGSRSAYIATANAKIIQPIAIQNSGPSLRPRRGGATATSRSMLSSNVAMTDPWIENGVEHVDDEVQQHEAGTDQQHHALEDDEVA